MKSEALLLLKNLLDRLDADALTGRPQFLGVVSEGEREALRLLTCQRQRENGISTHRP